MSDGQLPPAAISGRRLMLEAESAWGRPLCCARCYEREVEPGTREYICRPMFLCPTCGNKRCAKASDHTLECGGSNEPGQAGSVYQ